MLLSAHLLQCFQPHLEEVAHSRGHTLLACKPVLGSAKLCVGCRPCKQREVRRAAQQPLLCCRDRRSWEQGCSAAAAVSSTQEAELSIHAAALCCCCHTQGRGATVTSHNKTTFHTHYGSSCIYSIIRLAPLLAQCPTSGQHSEGGGWPI